MTARRRSASPARHRAPVHGRPAGRRRPGAIALLTASSVAFVAGIASGATIAPPPAPQPDAAATTDDVVLDAAVIEDSPVPDGARQSRTSRHLAREEFVIPDIASEIELPAPPSPKEPDEDGLTAADRADGLLGTDVPERGDGELVVVPGSREASGSGPVRTVRVEVEGGLPVDHAAFAERVIDTLTDPRGWGAQGELAFEWTDGPADIRVVLASPGLTDQLCAPLNTNGKYSCASEGKAVLNFRRWVEPPSDFDTSTHYRQYLVNHEVGHLLGKRHQLCPAPGAVAPVMQQQSASSGQCIANGWPFPDAS